jgi:predicted RNA-binding Zn-ribbon protein involved in translation (DUF1610 family)
MSITSMPVPLPRCTACDVALVADGGRRACPRCGRSFIASVVKAGGTAVYRDAPVFELEPAHDPPPRGSGLRVRADGDVLDVRIGGPGFLSNGALSASLGAILVSCFALIPLELWLHLSIGPTFLAVGILFALVLIVTRPIRRETQEIVVSHDRLYWRLYDGHGALRSSRSYGLDTVIGAHDDDDRLHIAFADGATVAIGNGISVPRRVRRWLAQRIAERLPKPKQVD